MALTGQPLNGLRQSTIYYQPATCHQQFPRQMPSAAHAHSSYIADSEVAAPTAEHTAGRRYRACQEARLRGMLLFIKLFRHCCFDGCFGWAYADYRYASIPPFIRASSRAAYDEDFAVTPELLFSRNSAKAAIIERLSMYFIRRILPPAMAYRARQHRRYARRARASCCRPEGCRIRAEGRIIAAFGTRQRLPAYFIRYFISAASIAGFSTLHTFEAGRKIALRSPPFEGGKHIAASAPLLARIILAAQPEYTRFAPSARNATSV